MMLADEFFQRPRPHPRRQRGHAVELLFPDVLE